VLKRFLKQHPILSLLVGGFVAFFFVDWAFGISIKEYQPNNYSTDQQSYRERLALFNGPFSFYVASIWEWIGRHVEPISAAITALATGVMAIFTGRLWFSTEKLWSEAKAASEIANKTAEAAKKSADTALLSIRPWLSCSAKIVGQVAYNAEGAANFPTQITVRNVGSSPATNVHLFFTPRLILQASGEKHSILQLQELEEQCRSLGWHEMEPGVLLFPGKKFRYRINLPIRRDAIIASCKGFPEGQFYFWAEMIVLVSYAYPLGAEKATTGAIYSLSKGHNEPFVLNEIVPEEDVWIRPHGLWRSFAR